MPEGLGKSHDARDEVAAAAGGNRFSVFDVYGLWGEKSRGSLRAESDREAIEMLLSGLNQVADDAGWY